MGRTSPPYDFTWAFVLDERWGDPTRLLVRERYRNTRWWAPLLIEPVELISLVMSQKMLCGMRARAERRSDAAAAGIGGTEPGADGAPGQPRRYTTTLLQAESLDREHIAAIVAAQEDGAQARPATPAGAATP